MDFIRRALRHAFTALIALVLVFEEWGWEQLSAVMGRLARLPLWAWMEQRIRAVPPWGAIVLFAVPALALLPVKLLALFLIGGGHPVLGMMVLLGAKLVGTALLARLFTLTQPALMRLPWFARLYTRWSLWKERVLTQVRASWAWRWGRVVKRRVAQRWARWRHAA